MSGPGVPWPEQPSVKSVVAWAGAFTALHAASGARRRYVRRRADLTGRTLARYVARQALVRAALVEAAWRWAAKVEREREITRADLAAELGCEPTEEELDAALMNRSAAAHA